MGALNAQGIYEYDGTEFAAQLGGGDLLNLLGASVSDRLNLRVQRGTATLTTPDGTVKNTAAIAFAEGFAAAPNVLVGSAITSGGIVVNTAAVSVGTGTFAIRYKATGTVGSNVTVEWIAVGVIA